MTKREAANLIKKDLLIQTLSSYVDMEEAISMAIKTLEGDDEMKFISSDEVNEFIDAVNSCESNVFLISKYGDQYNLKSALSQYIAIGALLKDESNDLELWCDSKSDEAKMIKYVSDHLSIFKR